MPRGKKKKNSEGQETKTSDPSTSAGGNNAGRKEQQKPQNSDRPGEVIGNTNPDPGVKGHQQKPTESMSIDSDGVVLGGPQSNSKKQTKPKVSFSEESTKKNDSESDEIEIVTPGASNLDKHLEFSFAAPQKPSDDPDNPFVLRDPREVDQEFLEKLPQSVQTRIKALRMLHKNYIEVKKEFQKELMLLEKKYEDLYAPNFAKRNAVITGAHQITPEDLPEEERDSFVIKEEDPKGIPEFWLQALLNHDLIGSTITERDTEALKYLEDLKCVSKEEEFELCFHFAENPYFSDKVLTKKYFRQIDDDGEETYSKAEGCTIHWKHGKNLTVEKVKQKKKKKGSKKAAIVFKEKPCESFFLFFSPPEVPEEDDSEDDDEGALDLLERDFDIGSFLKDRLIPSALLWFTGDAAPSFSDDMLDDDEEEFDFDDDDDDDEDEDEDDRHSKKIFSTKTGHHTSKKPSSSSKPNQGPSEATPVDQPPDCKQQ